MTAAPHAGFTPDVIVVGAGLAGLVATHELAQAGRRVLVLDQENRANLGGQAFWSLGGLFFVDSPEQRRIGIKDSDELALQDWLGSAQFDRLATTDAAAWGRRSGPRPTSTSRTGEKRDYLRDLGLRSLPMVGWAERGDGRATGHGNSVPRFHLTWGTGPEVVRIFAEPVLAGRGAGPGAFAFRHQVDELIVEDGAVVGVRGSVLSRRRLRARREVVARGGRRVRAARRRRGRHLRRHRPQPRADARNWPTERIGPAPEHLISGVPAHVDGRMLEITEGAGATIVNRDRMWHYTEGIHNWDPIWPDHAIRIIPGPSSLWFDATGRRLAAAELPRLRHQRRDEADPRDRPRLLVVRAHAVDHREGVRAVGLRAEPRHHRQGPQGPRPSRLAKGAPGPVETFKEHGDDFVVADTLADLVAGMNKIARGPQLDHDDLERQIVARDREVDNAFTKDVQLMAIHNARRSRTDKIVRVAKPHRLLDPAHGPLIAVRLNILTRKTLGGLETNLDAQAWPPTAPRPRPVRRGRGRRLRRRRRARLQRARGHLPRRLHLLRPRGGPRARALTATAPVVARTDAALALEGRAEGERAGVPHLPRDRVERGVRLEQQVGRQ